MRAEKSAEEKDKRKPVLRLALTEESIHYVGSNKLRFHHHVVRALPRSAAKGTDLKDGRRARLKCMTCSTSRS